MLINSYCCGSVDGVITSFVESRGGRERAGHQVEPTSFSLSPALSLPQLLVVREF